MTSDEVYESKDTMIPENPDDEVYELDEDRPHTTTPLDPPAGTGVDGFPERWANIADEDSDATAAEFGKQWAGDNQPDRDA